MSADQEKQVNEGILNRTLHEIHDWKGVLGPVAQSTGAVAWLNTMLGVPSYDEM